MRHIKKFVAVLAAIVITLCGISASWLLPAGDIS